MGGETRNPMAEPTHHLGEGRSKRKVNKSSGPRRDTRGVTRPIGGKTAKAAEEADQVGKPAWTRKKP